MKHMTFSALIKERGTELTDCLLTEVEIAGSQVTKVVETFVIDIVVLAHLRKASAKVTLCTIQLASEIAAQGEFDKGYDDTEVWAMDLRLQAATSTTTLTDGTIWFKDREDGKDVYWCIHDPHHPLLPGHQAARLD